MESTRDLFKDMTSELMYVVPQLKKWKTDNPTCASALKLKVADWPLQDTDAHFVGVPFNKMKDLPIDQQLLRDRYDDVIKYLKKEKPFFEKKLEHEVAACIARSNFVARYRDSHGQMNESSFRMQVADQVVLMLCSIYNFTFEVEDSMIEPDPEIAPQVPTASSTLTESVTQRRKTDYICFSVHNGLRLTTVVLETKAQYHQNAIAQLMGYYIRACSNRFKAGICILLTPTIMQLVLFPFMNEQKTPLVNAICLKPVNYCSNLQNCFNL